MHPADIFVSEEGSSLRIVWADGSISQIGGQELRNACGCSLCLSRRREASSGRRSIALLSTDSARIVAIDLPSSSRLSVTWRDGHDDSLYRFDELIDLFPPIRV